MFETCEGIIPPSVTVNYIQNKFREDSKYVRSVINSYKNKNKNKTSAKDEAHALQTINFLNLNKSFSFQKYASVFTLDT